MTDKERELYNKAKEDYKYYLENKDVIECRSAKDTHIITWLLADLKGVIDYIEQNRLEY